MALDFECESHDLDEQTANLMETTRLLYEEQIAWIDWPEDLVKQRVEFALTKFKTVTCLRLITGISGEDAERVVHQVVDGSPEEYVPWLIYKQDYLPKNKELQESIKHLNRTLKK